MPRRPAFQRCFNQRRIRRCSDPKQLRADNSSSTATPTVCIHPAQTPSRWRAPSNYLPNPARRAVLCFGSARQVDLCALARHHRERDRPLEAGVGRGFTVTLEFSTTTTARCRPRNLYAKRKGAASPVLQGQNEPLRDLPIATKGRQVFSGSGRSQPAEKILEGGDHWIESASGVARPDQGQIDLRAPERFPWPHMWTALLSVQEGSPSQCAALAEHTTRCSSANGTRETTRAGRRETANAHRGHDADVAGEQRISSTHGTYDMRGARWRDSVLVPGCVAPPREGVARVLLNGGCPRTRGRSTAYRRMRRNGFEQIGNIDGGYMGGQGAQRDSREERFHFPQSVW